MTAYLFTYGCYTHSFIGNRSKETQPSYGINVLNGGLQGLKIQRKENHNSLFRNFIDLPNTIVSFVRKFVKEIFLTLYTV